MIIVEVLQSDILFVFYISAVAAKEKPPINLVGDVSGRIAILIVRL